MNRRRFTQQLAAAVGAISLGSLTRGAGTTPAPALRVDGERINRPLSELAQFGKNPYGGVSRVAYSEFEGQGREWAMKVMREADLAGRISTRCPMSSRNRRRRERRQRYNHFLAITSGLEHLPEIGRLVLWQGAQPLRIDAG